MHHYTILLWLGFFALIVFMLWLDLRLVDKKPHEVHMREAIIWTVVWVLLALSFGGVIYYIYQHNLIGEVRNLSGREALTEYLTGWLIEKSLSVDNIFVFALIFSYFNVPLAYQHRVLFWGIIGAVIFRAAMILLGAALVHHFSFVNYVFAAFLLYAAMKMLFFKDDKFDPSENFLFRFTKKIYPVATEYHGPKFLVKSDGRWMITPLFLVLLVIESSDVLFAFDSVPAIFGVTKEAFIVFTSNIFAILGLRSLYFVLAAMIERFSLLKYSLVLVLVFVAIKMFLEHVFPIPTWVSLVVVLGLLASGVVTSLVFKRRSE